MNNKIYRYRFSSDIPFEEIEESLMLAAMAAEGLFGRSQVRLEASFCMDREKRSCVVDASTEIGRHIARIFTNFLTQEFGEESFRVERAEKVSGSSENSETTPVGQCAEES